MYKKLLIIDTLIIIALLTCAYGFNSMICYWLACGVFVCDLIALYIVRGFAK